MNKSFFLIAFLSVPFFLVTANADQKKTASKKRILSYYRAHPSSHYSFLQIRRDDWIGETETVRGEMYKGKKATILRLEPPIQWIKIKKEKIIVYLPKPGQLKEYPRNNHKQDEKFDPGPLKFLQSPGDLMSDSVVLISSHNAKGKKTFILRLPPSPENSYTNALIEVNEMGMIQKISWKENGEVHINLTVLHADTKPIFFPEIPKHIERVQW